MADLRPHSSTSNIVRFLLKHATTGQGLTGLSSASAGLIISTICDNEATATTYTVAGSTVETIATLGTFAAPTATKCRFKEVDATNHKGLYEFQFADARFAVANAPKLVISVTGAANLLDTDYQIQLTDPVRGVGSPTALPNAAADAAGGLPISDAGGLDLDAQRADVAAILVDTAVIGAAGAGLTAVPWNASWDAEVQSEVQDAIEANNLDHVAGTATGIPAIPAGTYIDQIMDDGTAVYDRTTDSLQAIRDRGDAAWTTGSGGGGNVID